MHGTQLSALTEWLRREVHGEREHKLRVYSELIFGHQVIKLAKGTDKYNRTCMSHPFRGRMTAEEASTRFTLAIDGFEKIAYYKPEAPTLGPGRRRHRAVPLSGPELPRLGYAG